MTVTVAGTWTATNCASTLPVAPQAAAQPVTATVATTAGDWLIAVITWTQQYPGQDVSACIADDAHNWWEPLGAPTADTSSAGLVRCAIWAAPAARATRYVQAAPTGPYLACALAVIDVAGMAPGFSLAAITQAFHAAASSLTASSATITSPSLVIAACGWDASETATTPGGMTSLVNTSAVGSGTAAPAIGIGASWQAATGTMPAASWSLGTPADMAAATVAVVTTAALPAQASPGWPVVITEAAIGSGPQTPPSQMSWTSLASRSLALSITQGRQYTLGQLQAGQGTLTLDDPDGALIPPGTGAYSGIDSGTPVRRRLMWPGGAWQLQVAGNGTTANPFATTSGIPAAGGVTCPVSAWMLSPQGWAGGAQLSVDWYATGGGYISTSSVGGSLPAGQVTMVAGTVTAPATAATAAFDVKLAGTPPAATVLYAAAAPPQAGQLAPAPSATWTAGGSATVTTMAPWQADPRGPGTPAPWSVPFSGYLKRWPWKMDGDLYRGQTTCEVTDIWGYAAGTLSSMLREEVGLDSPYAYWPLSDPAGSADGSNIAQGNSSPMVLVTSKNGAGGSTVTWSASLPAAASSTGSLLGDTSARITSSGSQGGSTGVWQQQLSGTSLDTNGYGSCLTCYDAAYPPVSGGVTIEGWICGTSNTNTTGFGFSNGGNVITVPNSSFPSGTPITFTVDPGYSLPAGMTAGVVYYVIAQSGATFQVSATPGGGAVSLTTNGAGFCATSTPWNMIAWSARNLKGRVVELAVRASDGALLLNYTTTAGSSVAVVVDATRDYRFTTVAHVSVACSTTTYRVLVDGGLLASASGSFSAPIASSFDEFTPGGVFDGRGTQGGAWCGFLAHLAIFSYQLPVVRVIAHYVAGVSGLAGDLAHGRIDRALEYAGIAGRRLIMPLTMDHSLDPCTSGQDVGGQSAATMAGNIQQATLPALLYIAPTGDSVYLARQYTWNNPVKWVLGDNTAAGEIPVLPGGVATDYDPARLANDIQLAQLDTQSVTLPAGIMSSTTVGAIEAASEAQYGDIPYQQTGYLQNDYSSPYVAGSGLLDLADWIAMVFASPRNRIQAVTVNAAASPSAWPLWAQASVGDMVTVNARPPTASTSPLLSITGRITQTTRQMKWAVDGADASIGLVIDFAPEFQALICDDAVRGLLNGQNYLAWLRAGPVPRAVPPSPAAPARRTLARPAGPSARSARHRCQRVPREQPRPSPAVQALPRLA